MSNDTPQRHGVKPGLKVNAPIDPSETMARIFRRLDELGCDPRDKGDGIEAICPVHRSSTGKRNFSVVYGDRQPIVMNCMAGCQTTAILETLGLEFKDVCQPSDDRIGSPSGPRATSERPPSSKVQPPKKGKASLQKAIDDALWGLKQPDKKTGEADDTWKHSQTWRYPTADNADWAWVARFDNASGEKEYRPLHTAEGKFFIGDPPGKLPLYNLPQLKGARLVYWTEGEKPADALASLGYLATTTMHGAKATQKSDLEPVNGIEEVVVCPDNDDAGEAYLQALLRLFAELPNPPTVRVLRLPGLEPKGDAYDWIADKRLTWSDSEIREGIEQIASELPVEPLPLPTPRPASPSRPTLRVVSGESNDSPASDRRPIVVVTTDEYQVNDQAVEALSADETVFKRGFMLATVQRVGFQTDKETANANGIKTPPGSPRIAILPLPRLRELVAKNAEFKKHRANRDGSMTLVPSHPPEWCVNAISARGEWPSIRELVAIVECPILKPDGSVLETPGYDRSTGILYEPNADFLPVKAKPTQDDARAAAALLLDVVIDFPFAGPAHKVAWLSAVLTALARFAITDPTPLFLVDATQAGTGKSKLCDIVAIIRTGREMARKDYPDDNEEMRKTITAIALEGVPLLMFDNVDSRFGGSAIDAVLTAKTWKDRLLGRSEMTADIPLQTIWFATGNNVALGGDIMRRIVPSRLVSEVENPEERAGFKYPEVLDHVLENRPKYVQAALTILRAYVVAGTPDQGLKPFGSYGKWSKVVRSAVYWATGVDPCEAREDLRASDDVAATVASIIEGWSELPNARHGYTIAEVVRELKDHPALYEILRQAFMSWSRNDDLPPTKTIGNRLKGMQGRVIGGQFLHPAMGRGRIQIWSVRSVSSQKQGDLLGGSGGSGGSDSRPPWENCTDNCNTKINQNGENQTHQTHQTHQVEADNDLDEGVLE